MSSTQTMNLIWSHAWQITVLTVVVIAMCKLFSRARPHLGHLLWGMVLIKALVPPVIPGPIAPLNWIIERLALFASFSDWFQDVFDRCAVFSQNTESIGPNVQLHDTATQQTFTIAQYRLSLEPINRSEDGAKWMDFLFWFWLLSVLIAFFVCVLRYIAFRVWLRMECAKSSDEVSAAHVVECITRQIGMKTPPRVRVLNQPLGPAVIGLWNPTILLPRILIETLEPTNLRILIAHELVHIRRRDLLWSSLQSLARSLWWFHPLVWYACRKLSQESERSCDVETIATLECRSSTYAHCLLKVLEQKHRLHSTPNLPGVRPVQITAYRLESIMKMKHGKRTESRIRLFGIGCLTLVLVLPYANYGSGQQSTLRNAQNSGNGMSTQPTQSDSRQPTTPSPVKSNQQKAEDKDGDEMCSYDITDNKQKMLEAKWCKPEHVNESVLSWIKEYEAIPMPPVATQVYPQPMRMVPPADVTRASVPVAPVRSFSSAKEIGRYALNGDKIIVVAPYSIQDEIRKKVVQARKNGFRTVVLRADILSGADVASGEQFSPALLNMTANEALAHFQKEVPGTSRLSSPRMCVMNGETAICVVGTTEIPRLLVHENESKVIQASSETTHVGFSLEATPRLQSDGSIFVHLKLKRSELWPETESVQNDGTELPNEVNPNGTVSTATLETSVSIPVGATRVLKMINTNPKKPQEQRVTFALVHCSLAESSAIED